MPVTTAGMGSVGGSTAQRDFGTVDGCLRHIKGMFFFDSFRRHHLLPFALILAFALMTELPVVGSSSVPRRNQGARVVESDRMCSEVRSILESKVKDVGDGSEGSRDSGICNSGSSICCTNRMEGQLVELSRTQTNKMLADKMKILKQTFFTWTAKFDTFFIQLINRSKKNLHDLFVRSYGEMFNRNTSIFIQLFDDLTGHFKSAELNLSDALDRFFSGLFHRVFSLYNDQYTIDGDFQDCLDEHFETLRPFNDVPNRMESQLRRTFLIARTFTQGLSEAKKTILTVVKQSPDDRCLQGMTQMAYCPLCRGLSSAKPCIDYCIETASKCLRLQVELHEDWNAYLEAVVRVSDSLSSSFSIESVVNLLDTLINEAIEHFQSNAVNITSASLSVCGDPSSDSRRRREAVINVATTTTSESFLGTSNSSSLLSLSSSSSSSLSSMENSSTAPAINETATIRQVIVQQKTDQDEEQEQRKRSQVKGQDRQRQRSDEQQKQQQQQQQEEEAEREKRSRKQRKKHPPEARRQKVKDEEEEEEEQEEEHEEEEEQKQEQEQEQEHEEEEYEEEEGEEEEEESETEELRHRSEDQGEQRRRPHKSSSSEGKSQLKRGRKKPQRPQQTPEPEERLTPLQELIRDFRVKLNSVKDTWTRLPLSVCENLKAELNNETTCWNGFELTRGISYDSTWKGRKEGPENVPSSVAKKEILRLRDMAAKLRQASNGWDDRQETEDGGSGLTGLDFGGSGVEPDPRTLLLIRTSIPPEVRHRPSQSSSLSPPTITSLLNVATVVVAMVATIVVVCFH